MRHFAKLLLLSILLCLLQFVSIAQKSTRTARKPAPPPIICKIADVPKGMVVVGYKSNAACAGGNQLLVKRAENADIICAASPVPPNFFVLTEAQGDLVGSCPNKAFLIQEKSASVVDDDPIGRAFASRASDIQVEGEGTVMRLLADDLDGSRHQRFLVQLASGQTLLIAHNIDVAPRIDGLKVGDSVSFNGEYVWNEKGGVIHWTHHDPRGRHVAGWVKLNGKKFQ
jgi:Protein of unknown function (DUF3465)